MQRKVAWIEPEESKSGKAIGVALNDTACCILKRQLGNHQKRVFVHTEAVKRADGAKKKLSERCVLILILPGEPH